MLTGRQEQKILKLQHKFLKLFYDKKTRIFDFGGALNALISLDIFVLDDLILLHHQIERNQTGTEKFTIRINQLKRDLLECHTKHSKIIRSPEPNDQEG